jgi:hypothetical protein
MFGQSTSKHWLFNKFKTADTILLVSHDLVKGSTDQYVDINNKTIPFPELTFDNKPNFKIIKEQVILNDKQKDTLLKILERPFKDSTIKQGCILTHHAIFIIKNGKTSFLNLSFECRSFETSKDLKRIENFDDRRWDELEAFFRQMGFTSYLRQK